MGGIRSRLRETQDLRTVPSWVRRFFHGETLRCILAFRDACVERKDFFLLACLLGILHHQRPGFLSHPSSHLVPYLRDKKFPPQKFPELYQQRDALTRLRSKLHRTFRRAPAAYQQRRRVFPLDARSFPRLRDIGAVITSPPYMNQLDYVRDNRLRLWFISRHLPTGLDLSRRGRDTAFTDLMRSVCGRLAPGIRPGGAFVLVLGDATRKGGPRGRPAFLMKRLFLDEPSLRSFRFERAYRDRIPDIRRSRREFRGTKTETVLIYRKSRDSRSARRRRFAHGARPLLRDSAPA